VTPSDLAGVCATRDLIVVCGAGGVGKTTIAAAMAVTAAVEQGGRVLVLTVDPARRLADALGVSEVGNAQYQVPLPSHHGAEPRGELWAAMLDARAGWDELVTRHAPNPSVRDRLLSNPLYRDVTGRFAHSHEYLAMERLHEVHTQGRYDLVIVDTPPSNHAIDVLDAPGRMVDFFQSRLLRWLTVPSRSTLAGLASRPFYQVLDRVLGARFGEDLAEMFALLAELRPGFVARAGEVRQLLADQRTGYVVVSTVDDVAMGEAHTLAASLRARSLAPAAVVLNRGVPPLMAEAVKDHTAVELRRRSHDDDVMDALAHELSASRDVVATVVREMAERLDDIEVLAVRERQRYEEATHLAPVVVRVPTLDIDVTDVSALSRVGRSLWSAQSGGAD